MEKQGKVRECQKKRGLAWEPTINRMKVQRQFRRLSGKLLIFFIFFSKAVFFRRVLSLLQGNLIQHTHWILASSNSFSYCFLFHELRDAITSFFLQKGCVHWALPPVQKVSKWLGVCCVFWLKGEIATNAKFVLTLQNWSYSSASPVWNYVVFFFNHRMFWVVGDLLVII